MEITNGKIDRIQVCRGAPCGATWDAAKRVEGLPVKEAEVRIGLETQFFCSADPSGWDPIHGKSPVHFAGDVHIAALKRALKKEIQSVISESRMPIRRAKFQGDGVRPLPQKNPFLLSSDPETLSLCSMPS